MKREINKLREGKSVEEMERKERERERERVRKSSGKG